MLSAPPELDPDFINITGPRANINFTKDQKSTLTKISTVLVSFFI